MIERPEDYLEAFVEAGADALSVHVEACPHLYHAVESIKALGVGAGVALNPGTDLTRVREVASLVDLRAGHDREPGLRGAEDDRPRPWNRCPS